MGALWPLMRWYAGTMLVVVLGITPMFVGMGILMDGPLRSWERGVWVLVAICSLLVGSIAGHLFWKHAQAERRRMVESEHSRQTE